MNMKTDTNVNMNSNSIAAAKKKMEELIIFLIGPFQHMMFSAGAQHTNIYIYIYPMRCARQAATVPSSGLEIKESCFEKQLKSVQNWRTNCENWDSRGTFELMGDPLGAKMAQDAIWGASGAPFGCLLGRILAPRWAKLEPRWRHVGQLGAKMCPRRRTWSLLGVLLGASCWLFLYLGRDLSKLGEN